MQKSSLNFTGYARKHSHCFRRFVAALIICIGLLVTASEMEANSVASPNGRLKINFYLTVQGAPRYSIELDGKPVLLESKLGLVRDDANFSANLKLLSASKTEPVSDRYEILTAKRRINNYRANRAVFHLRTAAGKKLDIIFQVSNDGAAFRYFFPETDSTKHRLSEEVSSFRFLPETRAWLQPMAVARTGWKESQPSYEEYYEKDVPVGTPSAIGAGWVYPALFRSGGVWVLLSETGISRNYCGTRLRHESTGGEYKVGFPDPKENFQGGAVNPESKSPWLTPWRLIAVGSLATIAESTLGVDLAEKPSRAEKFQIMLYGYCSSENDWETCASLYRKKVLRLLWFVDIVNEHTWLNFTGKLKF